MSRSDAWMPLYIGDYLRDTGHLTGAEHGAYLLLLMQAWTRGGSLPTDDERLRHLARMSSREWAKARDAVLAFFEEEDGALRNRRLDRELARSAHLNEKRRAAGAVGAEKRWKNNGATMASGMAEPLANASQLDGPSQSQLTSITPSTPSPNGEGSEGESPARADDPPPGDLLAGQKPSPKPPKPQPPEIPMETLWEMAAAWNEVAARAGWKQVSEINAQRAAAMRARIRERWARDPLGKWRNYLEAIAAIPFCSGENTRGWRATIDWAIRPNTPVKIAEGHYSDEAEAA